MKGVGDPGRLRDVLLTQVSCVLSRVRVSPQALPGTRCVRYSVYKYADTTEAVPRRRCGLQGGRVRPGVCVYRRLSITAVGSYY